jgi:hypothetical protein
MVRSQIEQKGEAARLTSVMISRVRVSKWRALTANACEDAKMIEKWTHTAMKVKDAKRIVIAYK